MLEIYDSIKNALASAATLGRGGCNPSTLIEKGYVCIIADLLPFRNKERNVIPMEHTDAVRMSEIIEMLNCLVALSFDGYTGFKYIILPQFKDHESEIFFTKLFEIAEKRRPKLICMKEV